MCGIGGYVGLEQATGQRALRAISSAQVHRGPDGEGYFHDARFGLTHRRLAIIDPHGGHQPMVSADGRFVMTYNGEVYNYRKLRDELVGFGHEFRSASDTEVVLAAWSQWQEKALDRFEGMFALAIADTLTGTVTLARDPFGIKPLHFARTDDGQLVFASDISAILATGLIEPRPDDTTLYRYLRFRVHDDDDRTFFTGIGRVRPGQVATIDEGEITFRTYTNLHSEPTSPCEGTL